MFICFEEKKDINFGYLHCHASFDNVLKQILCDSVLNISKTFKVSGSIWKDRQSTRLIGTINTGYQNRHLVHRYSI